MHKAKSRTDSLASLRAFYNINSNQILPFLTTMSRKHRHHQHSSIKQILFYCIFYISERRKYKSSESAMPSSVPAAIGGTLGACVILIVSATLIFIR